MEEIADRAAAGRALRGRAQGAKSDQLGQALGEVDPALLEWADEHIFGTVWARPGLAFEDRMLVAIVALATQGQINQLRNYFHGALQEGVAAEKITEALLMLHVYAGFPAAINALACFRQVQAAQGESA